MIVVRRIKENYQRFRLLQIAVREQIHADLEFHLMTKNQFSWEYLPMCFRRKKESCTSRLKGIIYHLPVIRCPPCIETSPPGIAFPTTIYISFSSLPSSCIHSFRTIQWHCHSFQKAQLVPNSIFSSSSQRQLAEATTKHKARSQP